MTLAEAIEFRKTLGLRLIVLFVVSICLMLMTVEVSAVRAYLCENAALCLKSDDAASWNKLGYDLALGCAVSVFFYWLLVRWPDRERRARIKRSFAAQYKIFKLSCIETFVGMAEGGYDATLPGELMTLSAFRDFFNEDIGNRDTRWYRVANKLDEYYLKELIRLMETFRDEIAFVLHNTDVHNEAVMEFFKRLSRIINAHRNASPDYDSVKSFCSFMWSLFAGWDFARGYRDRDVVEEMIEANLAARHYAIPNSHHAPPLQTPSFPSRGSAHSTNS